MEFNLSELQVIYALLSQAIEEAGAVLSSDLSPEDRTECLDYRSLLRSAKKKVGLILQSAENR